MQQNTQKYDANLVATGILMCENWRVGGIGTYSTKGWKNAVILKLQKKNQNNKQYVFFWGKGIRGICLFVEQRSSLPTKFT